jgi:hypothetical protein
MMAAKKVFVFLKKNPGKKYCVDCLAALCDLNLRGDAAKAAGQLDRTGEIFMRHGVCDFCSRPTKTVIGVPVPLADLTV